MLTREMELLFSFFNTLFAFHLQILIALSSNLFSDLKSERSRMYANFFEKETTHYIHIHAIMYC